MVLCSIFYTSQSDWVDLPEKATNRLEAQYKQRPCFEQCKPLAKSLSAKNLPVLSCLQNYEDSLSSS